MTKLCLVFCIIGAIIRSNAQPGTTSLVSINPTGPLSHGYAWSAHVSPNGRYVVFQAGTISAKGPQIYFRDMLTGQMEIVSVDSEGNVANHVCNFGSVSGDGRFVAFDSYGSNLSQTNTNGKSQIYLHDRLQNTTTCISVNLSGQAGNEDSYIPHITPDGKHVAFFSKATKFAPGQLQAFLHAFVCDVDTGRIDLVSQFTQGAIVGAEQSFTNAPIIDDGGRFVVFTTSAKNPEQNDTNGDPDVYLRDRLARTTVLISSRSDGSAGAHSGVSPCIRGDGSYVVFASKAALLVDRPTTRQQIFGRNLATGTLELLSVSTAGEAANNDCNWPCISRDGKSIALMSKASNLAPNSANANGSIYWRELSTGITELASKSTINVAAKDYCGYPSVANGRLGVAFDTFDPLVPLDGNSVPDVYLRVPAGSTNYLTVTATFDGRTGVPTSKTSIGIFDEQGQFLGSRTITFQAGHSFALDLPAMNLTFHSSFPMFLNKAFSADLSQGDVSEPIFYICGDTDADDQVTIYDLTNLFMNYTGNGSVPIDDPWDLNADGHIDLKDISIVFRNFGLVGDW